MYLLLLFLFGSVVLGGWTRGAWLLERRWLCVAGCVAVAGLYYSPRFL